MRFLTILLLLPALALGQRCGDAFGSALFSLINTDNNFVISFVEFSNFVKLFDADLNGFLFFQEFLLLVNTCAPPFVGHEILLYYVLTSNRRGDIHSIIALAFGKIDTSNNGFISLEELQSAFCRGALLHLNIPGIVDLKIGK